MMKKVIGITALAGIVLISSMAGCNLSEAPEPEWPEITSENKPWTRWWWQGSAVDKENLTHEMEQFKKVNIGGVEITPIYGIARYEDQFIDYLSSEWVAMLEHTIDEGERLDIGVDMATGTGWPFGGPWVGAEDASKFVAYEIYELQEDEQLSEPVEYVQEPFVHALGNRMSDVESASTVDPGETIKMQDVEDPLSANDDLQSMALEQIRFEKPMPLVTLMAYSDGGETINLTDQVDEEGNLDWVAPEGNWTLYALFRGWHGKMVERAAPGGEGFAIDHFNEEALRNYLQQFDDVFGDHDISGLRSFFNDSYEVDDAQDEANWTNRFFTEFEQRRGYDLRDHLPALMEDNSENKSRRLLTDYRETISDLLLERFTQSWDQWAEGKEAMIRNQAHGSPANILDLYAASDIPETEGTDILRAKMASSAGNVTGKQLISAEAATWLNEHFLSSLADVKKTADRYFISGVNHMVYHGTAYSPQEKEWPGWLFYAAVHFNDRNPFWRHFGSFNQYIARVQSFLQSGAPDNDILLYFPIHDQWAGSGSSMLRHFDGGLDSGFDGSAFKQGAEQMVDEGYAFDFISDRQLGDTEQQGDGLQTAGAGYKTIVVPQGRYIPLSTFEKLIDLAREGATIIAYQGLPEGVSGFGDLEVRQKQFRDLVDQLDFSNSGPNGIEVAEIGEGKIIRGDSLDDLLQTAEIRRESMVDDELQYTRRKHESGYTYFITNWSDNRVDDWVPLSRTAASAAIFDPIQEQKGYADLREASDGGSEIYLQLEPGESCIVKTYDTGEQESSFRYVEQAGASQPLTGPWTLSFIEGGPELPTEIKTDTLQSWTEFDGESVKNFSGTGVYSVTFERPETEVQSWMLDLGSVKHSVRVTLNEQDLGTLIGPEYRIFIDRDMLKNRNKMEIEVTNLMANRIAYMDREGIPWKKFYNINFSASQGENRNEQGVFNAAHWSPRESGLLGPVELIPMDKKNPKKDSR